MNIDYLGFNDRNRLFIKFNIAIVPASLITIIISYISLCNGYIPHWLFMIYFIASCMLYLLVIVPLEVKDNSKLIKRLYMNKFLAICIGISILIVAIQIKDIIKLLI